MTSPINQTEALEIPNELLNLSSINNKQTLISIKDEKKIDRSKYFTWKLLYSCTHCSLEQGL